MPTATSYSPRIAYLALAVLVIASLAAIPVFVRQRQTLPSFKEPDLLISLESPPGTSHQAMVRLSHQVMQDLQAVAGVHNVGVHVGRAIFGDEIVGINSSKLWVNIDAAADYDATLFKIQDVIAEYPGIQKSVQTYLKNRSDPIVLGLSAANANALTARVYGENLDVLKTQAESVRQVISSISGVANAQVILPVEEPTIEIAVDLAKAEKFGMKPGDVRRAAAILLSGLQVGSLFEDQKVFEVVVWSTPEKRQSITNIRELLIDTPRNGRVRLQDVADVRVASSPNVIHRESISPYVDVLFDAQGRSAASVAFDVQTALRGMQFPLEYHARVRGEFAEQEAAQQRILLAIVMAAIGIFLLLQAVCERWLLTLSMFLTLPSALAGGLLVAMLLGNDLSSLGILAGLIAVLVIATRHGVMTISHMHHLQREDRDNFGQALILQGARERVVPILATTFAMLALLLPFIFFGNRPGLEIVRQIALIVVGGLVSSALFNLFVVPALYLRFGRIVEVSEWMSENVVPLPSK
jgi:Cu/Ag efflux pump CusA